MPGLQVWSQSGCVQEAMDQCFSLTLIFLTLSFTLTSLSLERNKILKRESTYQKDLIVVNIYAPNIEAPKYTKQILTELKGDINSETIIVWDVNIPLATLERSSGQRGNKQTNWHTTLHSKWTYHTENSPSSQQQQITYPSQVHTEHFQEQIIS